ncbi:hypothetical protein [Mycolicibacterium fortuitum]|uniref:hypothetical protein n=1 Tax=Mycolicibacterium fortuitum TaxID=1766 RepID=UPI003F5BE0E3
MTEQNTETELATEETETESGDKKLPPADPDQVGQFDPPDEPDSGVANASPAENSAPESEGEPDTFPREYVEKLRQENGKYRQRAQQADDLAQRLHTELVRASGKLADPTDLPYDENHLASADNMAAAIDDLLARKPHLAARKPVGDIGQGATPSAQPVSLLGLLKG